MNIRKEFAVMVLGAMAVGMISNALALWKGQAVLEQKVVAVEKRQEKQDNKNTEIDNKIYQMHWHLIESKGVKVPPRTTNGN